MTLSPYFEDLRRSYAAELDDLQTDSEGKNVLAARLQEKRRAFRELMPMIAFAPEMVAPAFHGGMRFEDPHAMTLLSTTEPEEFPAWEDIQGSITFEPWAEKLLPIVLAESDGERFILTVVCLEFLHGAESRRAPVRRAPVADGEDEDGNEENFDDGNLDDDDGLDGEGERRGAADDAEGDGADLDEAGADWMSEQGFDRRG